MDRISAMRVFSEVVTRGSFTAAANTLGMSRAMVTRYGMSEALGTMVYVEDGQGMGGMPGSTVSEETQQKVDAEIRSILDQQYALARRLLEENRDKVEAMTKALLDWETIDAEQVRDIMNGKEPQPPKYGVRERNLPKSGPVAPGAAATA
ncbi:MAG: hypothetical protein EON48_18510 [Acetobacteraceae bacterium]|nr:MAG: hypothetical protein EON48_18510 [Acetobacteraceae bacterium]